MYYVNIFGVEGKDFVKNLFVFFFLFNCLSCGVVVFCWCVFGFIFFFLVLICCFFLNLIVFKFVNERDFLCICLINWVCILGGRLCCLLSVLDDFDFLCNVSFLGGMLGSFFLDLRGVGFMTLVIMGFDEVCLLVLFELRF